MLTPWYKQSFHRTFRKGSRKGHGIHSPFMFNFITNQVENPYPFYAFGELEKNLKILYNSKAAIDVTDWGADFGLKPGIYPAGTISQRTELNKKSGELIFRIANRFKCRNIIHYGPTLGNNLLYLGKVDQRNQILLINQEVACNQLAGKILQENSLSHQVEQQKALENPQNHPVDLALINFPHSRIKTSQATASILSSCKEGSIVAIRGINANKGMKEWWKNFKCSQKTGVTLDLNCLGLYFVRSDLQNQHFIY